MFCAGAHLVAMLVNRYVLQPGVQPSRIRLAGAAGLRRDPVRSGILGEVLRESTQGGFGRWDEGWISTMRQSSAPIEYEEFRLSLKILGDKLSGLIKELLSDAGIDPLSVRCRVKDVDSVAKKLARQPGKYNNYEDLTDLLGFRVITYFSDTVDEAAAILKPQFTIDELNSEDKRAQWGPDQFGYMSLHFVATLTDERCSLPEYSRFRGIKFEVQVRSILQHAWAEIEHDLGYKVEGSLPPSIRRRFSRLAGLLEIADDEFVALRGDSNEYSDGISAKLSSTPAELGVDQSTIAELLKDPILVRLDEALLDAWPYQPATLVAEVDRTFAGYRADELLRLGLARISDVKLLAAERATYTAEFAERWLERDAHRPEGKPTTSLNRGIGLFYLGFTIAAEQGVSESRKWAEGIDPEDPDSVIATAMQIWAGILSEHGDPSESRF
jgi:ppGpp synthetase/RelA/SpoT-type nucleotidyltranferase